MANVNIDKFTLKDLLDLQDKVEKAIVAARDRERSEVKQKIEAIAQTAGFSLSDLGFGGRVKAKMVIPKYVNPDNRSETWTGRGRKPNWLVTRLAKGAKIEEFSIR